MGLGQEELTFVAPPFSSPELRLLDVDVAGHESERSMTRATPHSERLSRVERAQLLSSLVDEFERRGWREDGHTALSLVRLFDIGLERPTVEDVARVVPRRFLVRNETSALEVRAAALACQGAIQRTRRP
jgi:hypothetical protein